MLGIIAKHIHVGLVCLKDIVPEVFESVHM